MLPILHLNGYKIANPTILARIPHEELECAAHGLWLSPIFVEGDDPAECIRRWRRRLDQAFDEIAAIQKNGPAARSRPNGHLAHDRAADAKRLDRAKDRRRPQDRGLLALPSGALHIGKAGTSAAAGRLDAQLRPEELFDESGRLRPRSQPSRPRDPADERQPPCQWRGTDASAHLPDIADYAVAVEQPGATARESTAVLGA